MNQNKLDCNNLGGRTSKWLENSLSLEVGLIDSGGSQLLDVMEHLEENQFMKRSIIGRSPLLQLAS